MEFGACPRCKLEVSIDRKSLAPVVCNHCGMTISNNEAKLAESIERSTLKFMGLFTVLVLTGAFLLTNWDTHSLEIIPLKVKEIAGATSPSDWEQLASICLDLKKYDCVEEQYKKAALVDAKSYIRLGRFQLQRSEPQAASSSFAAYFQNGGTDIDAAYEYAKLLGEAGQVDQAAKYFEQVLAAKTDVLQVSVIYAYVKTLVKGGKYAEAKALIENVRKQAPTGEQFMADEMKQIESLTTASR